MRSFRGMSCRTAAHAAAGSSAWTRVGLGCVVVATAWAGIDTRAAVASEYNQKRARRFEQKLGRWFPGDLFHPGNPNAQHLTRFMIRALAEGYAGLTFRQRCGFWSQVAAPHRPNQGGWKRATRMAGQLTKFGVTQHMPLDAERIRAALNALGPGFIKLGQFLSVRPDLVTESLGGSLSNLCDRANPVPFRARSKGGLRLWPRGGQVDLATMLERDTGPIDKRFQDIDPQPISTASVGQAHHATDIDGRPGVLKIIKPGARERLDRDFEAFERALGLSSDKTSFLEGILRELHVQATAELDLGQEARNLGKLAGEVGPKWRVPGVLGSWGPNAVFLERMPGETVGELLRQDLLDAKERRWLAREIWSLALRGPLIGQLFHADPSPGNIMFDRDTRQLSLIDGGMVGQGFTHHQREAAAQLACALWLDNRDQAAQQLAALSPKKPSPQRLASLVDKAFEEPAGHRLVSLLAQAEYQGVRLPSRVRMAVKTAYQAEGTARRLDPSFQVDPKVLASTLVDAVQVVATNRVSESLHKIVRSPSVEEAIQRAASEADQLYQEGRRWGDLGKGVIVTVVNGIAATAQSEQRRK